MIHQKQNIRANCNVGPHYPESRVNELVELGKDMSRLSEMDVDKYVDLYVKN
jgi:2-methylcitrate dehydratase